MRVEDQIWLMARIQWERGFMPEPPRVRWSTRAVEQVAAGDEDYAYRLVRRYRF